MLIDQSITPPPDWITLREVKPGTIFKLVANPLNHFYTIVTSSGGARYLLDLNTDSITLPAEEASVKLYSDATLRINYGLVDDARTR